MTYFRRLVLVAALCGSPAAAAPFENLEALQHRLVAALGIGVGEAGGPAGPIDARLKLAACPEPASIEGPMLNAATIRCDSLGWRIRVPLVRAAAVAAAKAEPIVRKGDQVELVAGGSSFSISTLAIAEQDGARGDRIRVRGDRKSPPVTAEITGPGRVTLAGFK